MKRPTARRPPGPVRRPYKPPPVDTRGQRLQAELQREKADDDRAVLAALRRMGHEAYSVEVAEELGWSVGRAKSALTRLSVAGDVVSRVLSHKEHQGKTGLPRRYYWVRG